MKLSARGVRAARTRRASGPPGGAPVRARRARAGRASGAEAEDAAVPAGRSTAAEGAVRDARRRAGVRAR